MSKVNFHQSGIDGYTITDVDLARINELCSSIDRGVQGKEDGIDIIEISELIFRTHNLVKLLIKAAGETVFTGDSKVDVSTVDSELVKVTTDLKVLFGIAELMFHATLPISMLDMPEREYININIAQSAFIDYKLVQGDAHKLADLLQYSEMKKGKGYVKD